MGEEQRYHWSWEYCSYFILRSTAEFIIGLFGNSTDWNGRYQITAQWSTECGDKGTEKWGNKWIGCSEWTDWFIGNKFASTDPKGPQARSNKFYIGRGETMDEHRGGIAAIYGPVHREWIWRFIGDSGSDHWSRAIGLDGNGNREEMTPNEDCKVHCKVESVCIEIKEQRNRWGLCLDLSLIIVWWMQNAQTPKLKLISCSIVWGTLKNACICVSITSYSFTPC